MLMTADTVGGVWTYCMDLCRGLSAHNVEVHLVTMGRKMNEDQKREVQELMNVTVYETAYKLEWMQEPWKDIEECGQWLLQLEQTLQPDVIHLNCFAYGSLPFSAPVVVVAHSDVWSWFEAVHNEAPPAEWTAYCRCVRNALHSWDALVAPSAAALHATKTVYGIKGGRVIYNGRNAALYSPREKQRIVFSMGRTWDKAKNVELLVKAAPFIGARIEIAGDNSFAGNKVDLASTTNISFLGKLSAREIATRLSTASVYVLPAKYEPFGLSVLEAALSGCALVLGDIPSFREIWQDAAIFVNTDDEKKLAGVINDLLQDESLLNKWVGKARQQALNYSLEKLTNEYCRLYQQLTKNIVQPQTAEAW